MIPVVAVIGMHEHPVFYCDTPLAVMWIGDSATGRMVKARPLSEMPRGTGVAYANTMRWMRDASRSGVKALPE